MVFLMLILGLTLKANSEDLVRYVNPFIGTGGHGHTFPGATVPFGMVQLSPDTRTEGWDACAGYHYSDTTILGFSHTHLSGAGIADYGDILIMPTTEAIHAGRAISRFDHHREQASPGFYSVYLADYDVTAELTAAPRVGFHRYSFPRSDHANIIINLHHGLGPDQVIESEIQIVNDHEILGFRRSSGWAKDQYIYFVAQFSKAFKRFGTCVNDTLHQAERSSRGMNIGGYVQFSTSAGEKVLVKVGISSVSADGARKNLQSEIPGWNFDDVRRAAEISWNKELSKIEVQGGTRDQRSTFYTALYHVMMAPNIFSDIDGSYRGMDRTIHQATGFTMYTVFSLWDTFRAEHPLLTIIDQRRTLDFIKSLIGKYQESGVLPVWELASNETWTMIGYHAIPVITDAYMKGIRDFDAAAAYEAMKHSASLDHFGLKAYRAHGHIPGEIESESVSKTLEYAYDDWCIAQMAGALGKHEDEDRFIQRAQYYKNVFDSSSLFMRPKVNASWLAAFDPTAVTTHYTEANAWQYTFFAPHDVNGLINLCGGKKTFVAKLDSLFYRDSEMTGRQQADITGLIGQYAQGNEPSHHVGYLYDYAGVPWKTQKIIRRIMDDLYSNRPAGLCGNDDCGQMSAWYVMSAIGLYQVTPGQPLYCIGSPLFNSVTIHLENGKRFVVSAVNNSLKNNYIQSATLNGGRYTKSFIGHEELMRGGELRFTMASLPNEEWGSKTDDAPHSIPMKPIVTVPYIQAQGKTFKDSIAIVLACSTPGAEIHYTLDGSDPTVDSRKYLSPISLTKTTSIAAFATRSGYSESPVMTAAFLRSHPVGTITLNSRYASQYAGGGDNALIDGIRGAADFRLGAWQGYEEHDLDAVVDLGSAKMIDEVGLNCLQDNNSWIFFPTGIAFCFSGDGTQWRDSIRVVNDVSPKERDMIIRNFGRKLEQVNARYVRVHADNIGKCPPWHKGSGGKAWLFVDEIIIDAR